MTAMVDTAPVRHATADPSAFCDDVFASLPRADQRRWAEVYVRGLLRVPGRKSIRRISEHVLGVPADQCLQQFLNQSPWRWEPVRRALAYRVAGTRPRALVVEDAVFPKTGSSSVGVARQAAPRAGRTLNCQLGLAGFLVNEAASHHPVNWRLRLPKSWDNDHRRRARARLPVGERHGPRWRDVLALLDETAVGWGLASAPVVLDAGEDGAPLLDGLRKRGLRYVVRVPAGHADTHPGVRQVLAEWQPDGRRPGTVWLTNLAAPLRELVGLVAAARGVRWELPRLRDDFGMAHFEGRSFAGWHHHLTLVSVAHAIRAGHDK